MTASNRLRHCPTCHCRPDGPDAAVVEAEIARLADLMGTTLAQLRSPGKTDRMAARRYAVVAAFRRLHPEFSLGTVGGFFARDHSTVIHALKRVRGVLVEDLLARYRQVEGANHETNRSV